MGLFVVDIWYFITAKGRLAYCEGNSCYKFSCVLLNYITSLLLIATKTMHVFLTVSEKENILDTLSFLRAIIFLLTPIILLLYSHDSHTTQLVTKRQRNIEASGKYTEVLIKIEFNKSNVVRLNSASLTCLSQRFIINSCLTTFNPIRHSALWVTLTHIFLFVQKK